MPFEGINAVCTDRKVHNYCMDSIHAVRDVCTKDNFLKGKRKIMKFLGCVLVIAISMLIGRLMAESYVDRVKNLSGFITALEVLKSKICFQQEIFL